MRGRVSVGIFLGAEICAEAAVRLQAPTPGDTRTEMDRVDERDHLARRFSDSKQTEYL
jgi:hypothetical protein